MSTLIETTKVFVEETINQNEGEHDHLHAFHVHRLAKAIAEKEGGVDIAVIACGALLHNIADSKFHDGDEEVDPRIVHEFLNENGASPELCDHVANIVRHISFKGSLEG